MSLLAHRASALLGEGVAWSGLGGDALGHVLGELATEGQWLVVVDEPDMAQRLVRAIRFFHPKPGRVLHYPADDVRPYDGFSPDPALPRARLKVLDRLDRGLDAVVVIEAKALMQRVPSKETRKRMMLPIAVGDTLEREDLLRWLSDFGYLAAERATEPGFFTARGDVVDLWPVGRRLPIRIDFFDDEVEDIRRINPETGRASEPRPQVRLPAGREECFDRPALSRASTELARLCAEQGRDNKVRRSMIEDFRAGIRQAGVEAYLPALVEVELPFQHHGACRVVLVHPDDVGATMREFHRSIQDRYELLDASDRPLVLPAQRYADPDEAGAILRNAHRVYDVPRSPKMDLKARSTDGFGARGAELSPVIKRLNELAQEGVAVGLVSSSEKRSQTLLEMLEPHGLFPIPIGHPAELNGGSVSLLSGDLPRGFICADYGLALIPDTTLFGHRARAVMTDRIHAFFDAGVTHVAQIKEGETVVHKTHGIGRYRGLARMSVGNAEQDFAQIEYRGGDMMYLPVSNLGQLSRYVPSKEGAEVKLDKLGGMTWEIRKGKVRDSLLDMADDLLKLSAKRELATRAPYPDAGDLFHQFQQSFPHDETPDQLKAIEACMEDLSYDVPMDRLLCGDVGFGKTEVAMRVAARVLESGRQVAVLCPTTVLAYQHVQTFRSRFEGLPVRVGLLCRFNTPAQDKATKEGLKAGELDVVVGTTALLGRGVRFKDLGLLIIDEEHRFGVKQKERLKKMRVEVDVLAMSATPIPRTLQMGLSGLREMSIMATPPKARLAVRTSVSQLKKTRIRDALLLELERGGQAFFVHNRVETIGRMAERVKDWVPEARVEVAHGQMDERKLEDILVRFTKREFDVLVCTAIMEAGIDLPNVNTMVVNRADQFGLAQLYQLRGRVGRGSVRAQCLLLLPDGATQDARRRVQVLVENSGLGAGFQVAAADLEMRGAGNLVGKAQSGNIDAVGYEVWIELLEQAVRHAKGSHSVGQVDTELDVPVPAFIPDQMVPDAQERLRWYQRISSAHSPGAIDRALEDLEIECGTLPVEVENLAGLVLLQLEGRALGLTRISWLRVRATIEIHQGSAAKQALPRLVKAMPKRFKVHPAEASEPVRVDVRFTPKEAERPLRFLRWVLAQLKRADRT